MFIPILSVSSKAIFSELHQAMDKHGKVQLVMHQVLKGPIFPPSEHNLSLSPTESAQLVLAMDTS